MRTRELRRKHPWGLPAIGPMRTATAQSVGPNLTALNQGSQQHLPAQVRNYFQVTFLQGCNGDTDGGRQLTCGTDAYAIKMVLKPYSVIPGDSATTEAEMAIPGCVAVVSLVGLQDRRRSYLCRRAAAGWQINSGSRARPSVPGSPTGPEPKHSPQQDAAFNHLFIPIPQGVAGAPTQPWVAHLRLQDAQTNVRKHLPRAPA